jgi:hypothetical protein
MDFARRTREAKKGWHAVSDVKMTAQKEQQEVVLSSFWKFDQTFCLVDGCLDWVGSLACPLVGIMNYKPGLCQSPFVLSCPE